MASLGDYSDDDVNDVLNRNPAFLNGDIANVEDFSDRKVSLLAREV